MNFLKLFDSLAERSTRGVAQRSARRGFLVGVSKMLVAGAFALGTAIFALRRRYGMKTFLEIAAGAIARKRKGARS